MKAPALLLLLVFPLALRAGDDLPPPTGRLVDYSEIQEIFDKRCVECHEGETAPNALNLIDTRSYNLLINEAAQSFPSLKRVKPGSAAQSFLFQKVNSDTPKAGQRMPIGTRLPVEEQVAIRDWINQGALPVNRNPVIDSGPSLSSPTPRAGEGLRFLIAVSDPNADPLTFAWDFGDGATSTLLNPVHTYASAGSYTATLTVKDDRNGERIITLNVTVMADSDTDADGIPNLADPDDDGDGFSDGLEALASSDPLNAASSPLGGSAVVPGTLTLAQFRARFDFKKSSNDSFGARVQFELPPGFSVSGQSALLDVGGILRSASFDAKGASSSATDSVKLKLKKLTSGPNLGADLSIKSKAATLADAFLGLQKASEADADDAALPRTVAVLLGGQVFSGAATVSYKRKKSGPGSAVLAR